LDEAVNKEQEQKAYKKRWDEIIDEIENSNETLEGEPERLRCAGGGVFFIQNSDIE
jgi:hypothetical protein